MDRAEVFKFMHEPELVQLLSRALKDKVIEIDTRNKRSIDVVLPNNKHCAFILFDGIPESLLYRSRLCLLAKFIRDVAEDAYDLSMLTSDQLHPIYENIAKVDAADAYRYIVDSLFAMNDSIFDTVEYFETSSYYHFRFELLTENDAFEFIQKLSKLLTF